MKPTSPSLTLILSLSLCTVACGDDDSSVPGIDAAATADGTTAGPDADPNAPDADLTQPDADPTAPDAGSLAVACGSGPSCDLATQECCIDPSSGTTVYTCIIAGDPCGGSLASCDGPEDCDPASPDVCCAFVAGDGMSFESQCGGCNNDLVVCHAAGDCGAGELCCADPLGFSACVATATCP